MNTVVTSYRAGWHRPLRYFAAAMAITSLVAVIGLIVDDRILVGAPIWAKPLKFSISLAVYAVTWSWLLSLQGRFRRTGWWLGTGIVAVGVAEMVIIIGQTIRGRQSHFNELTALDATLWRAMGATIMLLFLLTLVWTLLLWRQPLGDRSFRAAIRCGAVLSLVGMALAFLMVIPTDTQLAMMEADVPSLSGAHGVGVADGGPGLPLLGWSTTGGDLRIPHFVGMHALQAIPLLAAVLGYAATRLGRLRPENRRLMLVRVAAAGYAGLVALVTWQALRGQPIVAPDAATWGVLAALVGLVAIGVGMALTLRADHEPADDTAAAGTRIANPRALSAERNS